MSRIYVYSMVCAYMYLYTFQEKLLGKVLVLLIIPFGVCISTTYVNSIACSVVSVSPYSTKKVKVFAQYVYVP